MLSRLSFPPQLEKESDDIVAEFYLPCLSEARRYDRITGYFSSSVFVLLWQGMRDFVRKGGKTRIICSPALSNRDAEALVNAYQEREDDTRLCASLNAELEAMLADPQLAEPTKALASLIIAGCVDVRVADLERAYDASTKRMFHDKVGLFLDDSDGVAFRGSMNETFLGLSGFGHIESIDINPSWEGGRDRERVERAKHRFDALWNGEVPTVRVRRLPQVTLEELRRAAGTADPEIRIDAVVAHLYGAQVGPSALAPMPSVLGNPLRDHQLSAWEAFQHSDLRLILAHATGAGKTATALWAISQLLAAGMHPVVIVPTRLLLRQWYLAMKSAFPTSPVLRCGDGHDQWRSPGVLHEWLSDGSRPRLVLSVLATAVTDPFLGELRGTHDLFLVLDEVHSVGSQTNRRLLEVDADARLGLSATPERYCDPGGTDAILAYFNHAVHTYSLAEALHDRVLTPYQYLPEPITLTEAEQAQWDRLSALIRRRLARDANMAARGTRLEDDAALLRLRVARARVAKRAEAKTAYAVRVAGRDYRDGHRWVIYCEDLAQLTAVRQGLRGAGLAPMEYHTSMHADEEATLARFALQGGLLLAIRCLDEGVDIPSATHAIVLASSRNPRQFVQRRGRLLRRARGKDTVFIHDPLVIPPVSADQARSDGLVWGELSRAARFSQSAANAAEAARPLDAICIDRGLDVDLLWSADNTETDND